MNTNDNYDATPLGNRITNFSPVGKSFVFNLDKYTCYKKSSKKCCVTAEVIDKIGDQYLVTHVGDEMHCPNIANNIQRKGFDDEICEIMLVENDCGHYSVINGQHRICLAAKMGLLITVYCTKSPYICNECYKKNLYSKNLLQKIKYQLFVKHKGGYYLEKF